MQLGDPFETVASSIFNAVPGVAMQNWAFTNLRHPIIKKILSDTIWTQCRNLQINKLLVEL